MAQKWPAFGIACVLAASVLCVSSSAATAAPKRCGIGSYFGPQRIFAKRIGCAKANHVMQRYLRRAEDLECGFNCEARVSGFHCVLSTQEQYERNGRQATCRAKRGTIYAKPSKAP